MHSSPTAIGCRVKSGWAVTVLLAGPVDSPRVLARRRIELSDPSVPDTVHPYHAGLHAERTNADTVEQLSASMPRKAGSFAPSVVAAWLALTGHWGGV